jgi:hypothetical protein
MRFGAALRGRGFPAHREVTSAASSWTNLLEEGVTAIGASAYSVVA